ncbi:TPA: glycosyltransferase [Photobacterium damselae]
MKPLLISFSDTSGGAARAATRLCNALQSNDIPSNMIVMRKASQLPYIKCHNNQIDKIKSLIKPTIGKYISSLFHYPNDGILRSGNWLPSTLVDDINNSECDIVNLHWINAECLSIKDISKIRKPIVMTLHDMWPFCGSEHLSLDVPDAPFIIGYDKDYKVFDLDRITWNRKLKYWKDMKFNIVAPSEWMAKCASSSLLFHDFSISVIPNPIETDIFKPLDKSFCQEVLNLPKNKKLIGFGVLGDLEQPHKGFDLLIEALKKLLENKNQEIECVIFGGYIDLNKYGITIPTHFIGHVHDNQTLSIVYNSLDLMIVPSRIDNQPQTVTESLSCGIPVVAFDCTGLSELIKHKQTGYLAKSFDSSELSEGIKYILYSKDDYILNCRNYALKMFSFESVSKKYSYLYEGILSDSNS